MTRSGRDVARGFLLYLIFRCLQCAGVNPHAGVLNGLLQTGEVSRATRSAGCFGGGLVPAVTFAFVGNMHPEVAVPMERGQIGNHTGATKDITSQATL